MGGDMVGLTGRFDLNSDELLSDLLRFFGSALRTEAYLYLVTSDGDSVVRCNQGKFSLAARFNQKVITRERQRALLDAARSGKALVHRYKEQPLGELFAPVRVAGRVVAVLASGLLLIRGAKECCAVSEEETKGIDLLPESLLAKRLEWTVEAAQCIERVIVAGFYGVYLKETLDGVGKAGSSRAICSTIIHEVRRAVNADIGTILFSDEQGLELRAVAHEGSDMTLDTFHIPAKTRSVCWEAFRSSKPQDVPDVKAHVKKRKPYLKQCPETASEIAVPIAFFEHESGRPECTRIRKLGVLNVESKRKGAFSQNDRAVVEVFAKIAAASLVRRELLRESRVFKELAEAFAGEMISKGLLRKICNSVQRATHACACYLFLCEQGAEDSDVTLWATNDGFDGDVGKLTYKPGEGFTGRVLKTKKEDFVNMPELRPPVSGSSPKNLKGKGLSYLRTRIQDMDSRPFSLAASPLVILKESEDVSVSREAIPIKEVAVGVISLIYRDADARIPYFGNQETNLLRTLSDIIAPAIVHARALARLERMSHQQQTGLSLVGDAKRMRILYANDVQRKAFPNIDREKRRPCYWIYNKHLGQTQACPWCPVQKVLKSGSSGMRAEAITHSCTEPHQFVRHYRVTATLFRDPFTTAAPSALETIVDVTESVELQYLYNRLVKSVEATDVLKNVCISLGISFQALEGLVLVKDVNWKIMWRFVYVRERLVQQEKEILFRLQERTKSHAEMDSLDAYLDERERVCGSVYDFLDLAGREVEDSSWFDDQQGTIGFVLPDELPSQVLSQLQIDSPARFVVLPVPIVNPSYWIVLTENAKSPYFPVPRRNQAGSELRGRAVQTANQAIRAAELALDKINYSAFTKSAEFIEVLRKDIPTKSLEECFVEHFPKVLCAKYGSLFYTDLDGALLTLMATTQTRLLDKDGNPLPEDGPKSYRVASDDGLTGWVAYYNCSLRVPSDAFSESELAKLFEKNIKPNRPDIDCRPVWKGKINENEPGEHSFLGVPIRSSCNKVIGVARVSGKMQGGGAFSSDDEALLEVFCALLGSLLEVRHQTMNVEKRVAGTFAHRIGNDLLPAVAQLDAIRDNAEADGYSKCCAETAYNAVIAVADIVNKYRKYSGKMILNQTIVCFDECINKIIELLKHRYTQAAIELKSDVDAATMFNADPRALEDMFASLIVDSLQFHPRGRPRITVRCSLSENSEIVIVYTDDGPGIPEDIKELVFTPFFTTRENGTGLGLPDALSIVKLHDGTMNEEGVCGEGVRFRILLPVAKGGKRE